VVAAALGKSVVRFVVVKLEGRVHVANEWCAILWGSSFFRVGHF
jgi:hypothetical protein